MRNWSRKAVGSLHFFAVLSVLEYHPMLSSWSSWYWSCQSVDIARNISIDSSICLAATTLGRSPKWKMWWLCVSDQTVYGAKFDPCKYRTLNSSNQYKHGPATFLGYPTQWYAPSSHCQHADVFPVVKPFPIWKQKAQENSLRRFVDMVPQAVLDAWLDVCD